MAIPTTTYADMSGALRLDRRQAGRILRRFREVRDVAVVHRGRGRPPNKASSIVATAVAVASPRAALADFIALDVRWNDILRAAAQIGAFQAHLSLAGGEQTL